MTFIIGFSSIESSENLPLSVGGKVAVPGTQDIVRTGQVRHDDEARRRNSAVRSVVVLSCES